MKKTKRIFKNVSLSILAFLTFNTIHAQVIVPFSARGPEGTQNIVHKLKGDFEMIGNSNMQPLSPTAMNNNSTIMNYLSIDSTTLNSSAATLVFSNENSADHDSTQVVYAGLYWTGRAHASGSSPNTVVVDGKTLIKQQVKFKKQGEAYETIIADANDIYYPTTLHDLMYTGYADVTSYVQEHGQGEYTVADLMLREGNGSSVGFFGGWSLVVIYANPAMNSRNISVFDGHAYAQGGSNANYEIEVSGFETVISGNVNVKLGYMAGEGDNSLPGDYLEIKKQSDDTWSRLSHTNNLTTNFFNSSITTNGTRNPNRPNNFGIDIGVFNLENTNNDIIPIGAQSAEFKYGTTQDAYIINLFVFGVNTYTTKGKVVNDSNGLKDNNVNETGSLTLPTLYAHVFDGNGQVAKVVEVVNGEFELGTLGSGETNFVLSSTENVVGTSEANFEQTLPEEWVFTGESSYGSGSDGEVDGRVTYNIVDGDVTGLIFGLNKRPTAEDNSANPHSLDDYLNNNFNTVNPTLFISDDQDGHVSAIRLNEFPLNVDTIKVNGITYDASSFPTEGIIVPTNVAGNPIQDIEVYLTSGSANQNIVIPFYSIDNAGFESLEPGAAVLLIGTPLPVELASFDASPQKSVNVMNWVTHVEVNNKGFHIERSNDAKTFEKIGFVEATTEEHMVNNYQFIDEKPFVITYYRLKQEDMDGKYTYSNVRKVHQKNIQNNVNVYPNPAQDYVVVEGLNSKATIHMINAVGQEVFKQTSESNTIKLQIDQLPFGMYYIHIIQDGVEVQVEKVMITK